MAEGFARAYGQSVMVAKSAGLAPAPMVSPVTRKVMLERNIDLGDSVPKALPEVVSGHLDLVVNMSGHPFPLDLDVQVLDWAVPDPIGQPEQVHRQVRDQVEGLVQNLVLELGKRKR
jgi:arsenate reductase